MEMCVQIKKYIGTLYNYYYNTWAFCVQSFSLLKKTILSKSELMNEIIINVL